MKQNKKPHILLINDDGITAPGLLVLKESLENIGNISIVAPDNEKSATGHGITLNNPLPVFDHYYKDKFFGVAVEGTPADCVKLAISSILKTPPDIIVSGINLGSNTGYNVLYSGTVSGAAEGTIMGIPSIAISLDTYTEPNYKPAGHFIKQVVKKVLTKGLPKGTLLNINVPNVKDHSEIKGVKVTEQGNTRWKEILYERTDPKNRTYYWMTGEKLMFNESTLKDESAVKENHISITPLQFDLTDYDNIKTIKKFNFSYKSIEN